MINASLILLLLWLVIGLINFAGIMTYYHINFWRYIKCDFPIVVCVVSILSGPIGFFISFMVHDFFKNGFNWRKEAAITRNIKALEEYKKQL